MAVIRQGGFLRLVDNPRRRLDVELILNDDVLIAESGGEPLGSWATSSVRVYPENRTHIRIRFGDEELLFTPTDPDGFIEQFLPHLLHSTGQKRVASADSSRATARKKGVVGPAGTETPVATVQADTQASRLIPRLDPRLVALAEQPIKKWIGSRSGRRTSTVLGTSIAYTDTGEGPAVLFLHGGVGSSIWRGVVPHVAPIARAVTMDLVGTGESGRPERLAEDGYGWQDHVDHLEGFIRLAIGRQPVTLVMHGWASMVGLEWARRNPTQIRGICNMESILRPFIWGDLPESLRQSIKAARADASYVLSTDQYFQAALAEQVNRPLSDAVIADYYRNFGTPGDGRRAHLSAISGIAVGGKPAESSAWIHRCGSWLKASPVPKLLILGKPGYILTGRSRELALKLPKQTTASVEGRHLLPEESPDGVGLFLSLWLKNLT